MVAAEGATWVDSEIYVTSLVSIRSQDVCVWRIAIKTRLDKNWRIYPKGVWFGSGPYRKGFLPCCMLAASAVKAPRLAIPLASSPILGIAKQTLLARSPLLSRHGSQGNCYSCHTGWSSRLPDWLYPSQAATTSPGWVSKLVQAVRTTLYMALPAQLHASAALAPYCLKNCDGVWFGKGPGRAGGKDEVQQEGAQAQKKGSHLQKNCSKVQ